MILVVPINKAILYANACDNETMVQFPFLNSKLINHFEKRTVNDFDPVKLVNKLSIRQYLQENYNYVSVAPKKGGFEPTFLYLNLDFKQRELAKKNENKNYKFK